MAVVIRLTATGKKHRISYRIVATDRQNKRDGKIVENLGFYNPNVRLEDGFKINTERYKYWLSQGAKASPAVEEIIEGKGVRPPKPKKEKPQPKVEETASAAAPASTVVEDVKGQKPSQPSEPSQPSKPEETAAANQPELVAKKV